MDIQELQKLQRSFEEYIQGLDYSSFEELLIQLNCFVRGIPREEGGISNGYMQVDSLISPNNRVQKICLERALTVFKSLKTTEDKAQFLYYIINDLHLFSDGNGRTSRLIYELIANKNFDIQDEQYSKTYSHNSNDIALVPSHIFEQEHGIMRTSTINSWASYFLFQQLKITKQIESIGVKRIRTYGSGAVGDYASLYIPENIQKELSPEQIGMLHTILLDNDGPYSIGGLTMLIVATKTGKLKDFIQHNKNEVTSISTSLGKRYADERAQSFIFPIGYEPDDTPEIKSTVQNLFSSWSKEDYLYAIKVGTTLKEELLTILMDMFLDPPYYGFEESDGHEDR